MIDLWKKSTPMDGPEITFIKSARDQILKAGAFNSYAIHSESGTGEGPTYTVTGRDYEVVYYADGERRDLIADLQKSASWCENELSNIEAKLPDVYQPE